MTPISPHSRGFTLVELAIALMIIGLLIAGVLKGIELVQNARIVQVHRQMQSYDTAAIAFLSMYSALPGDIRNPGTRLPQCTAAPCTTSGNGDGVIGQIVGVNTSNRFEASNLFIHLNATKLIEGVRTAGWNSVPKETTMVVNPLGGYIFFSHYRHLPDPQYLNGAMGNFWVWAAPANYYPIAVNILAQYDMKFDDGMPFTGNAVLNGSGCQPASPNVYNMNNETRCTYQVKSQLKR